MASQEWKTSRIATAKNYFKIQHLLYSNNMGKKKKGENTDINNSSSKLFFEKNY